MSDPPRPLLDWTHRLIQRPDQAVLAAQPDDRQHPPTPVSDWSSAPI